MQNSRINEAVILAGGKSSRMGRDKALLPFNGEPTLAIYQYKRLSKIFDKVYISAKSNKFNLDIPIIKDKISDISSPMVALYSILSSIKGEAIFILGVDMPFISKEVIEALLLKDQKSSKEIIVAKSINGLEPLCAIYHKSILPTIKDLIVKDEHKLNYLLSLKDFDVVEFENSEYFLNLNRPSDYKKAKQLIG